MNYNQKYNKEHYKSFKVDLKNDEYTELQEALKKYGITKAEFLRRAMQKFYDEKRKTKVSKKT